MFLSQRSHDNIFGHGLKRKRSYADDAAPQPSTAWSSPARCSMGALPRRIHSLGAVPMVMDVDLSTSTSSVSNSLSNSLGDGLGSTLGIAQPSEASWLSGALNSRTRKRFRDNRPDEVRIHETTISKLFTAQRQHPNASPIPSSPTTEPIAFPQKSTLHSFWRLPIAPAVDPLLAQAMLFAKDMAQLDKCETCDRSLSDRLLGGDKGDAMDVDGGSHGLEVEEDLSCVRCRRRVCGICVVLDVEGRRCLDCPS